MKHTLSNGTIINDQRNIGLGISVDMQITKYASMGYDRHNSCFYALTVGTYVNANTIEDYIKDLETVKGLIEEANKLIFFT